MFISVPLTLPNRSCYRLFWSLEFLLGPGTIEFAVAQALLFWGFLFVVVFEARLRGVRCCFHHLLENISFFLQVKRRFRPNSGRHQGTGSLVQLLSTIYSFSQLLIDHVLSDKP